MSETPTPEEEAAEAVPLTLEELARQLVDRVFLHSNRPNSERAALAALRAAVEREREANAQVADNYIATGVHDTPVWKAAFAIAAAIRARRETQG